MKYLTIPLLACFLQGCSSSVTETRYYQLPVLQNITTGQEHRVTEGKLVIEPVQVANYLNGNGVVLQSSDVELTVARQHLWIDALDQQLQRQLLNQLALLLPQYQVSSLYQTDSYRLQVQVERFHGLANGKAILSGRYNIVSGAIQQQYPFYQEVTLADNGYAALVDALGLGWQQVMKQIAEHIKAKGQN